MTKRRRLYLLTALVLALSIPAGGVAWSYWSAGGNGAGTASTGTVVALSLSPGTPAIDLFPGGSTSVVFTATNTNTSLIHVNSLALDSGQGTGGFSVDGAHPGCSVAALNFTTQTNGGVGWDVPARVGAVNGTLAVTLPNALAMTTAAANACQGATFAVFLVAG